jgi:hypothetical protein
MDLEDWRGYPMKRFQGTTANSHFDVPGSNHGLLTQARPHLFVHLATIY